WARDNSWRAPPSWEGGRVTNVELLGRAELRKSAPRDVSQRVRVAVRVEHELAVGDLLLFRGQIIGLLSRFVADGDMPRDADGEPVDLVVSRAVGERLGWRAGDILHVPVGRDAEPASHVVQARAIGVYSLISQRPLNSPGPGQLVSAPQIRW